MTAIEDATLGSETPQGGHGNALVAGGRHLKSKADALLVDVFRSIFEEIDLDKLRAEVTALRAARPEIELAAHADTLARRSAIRCAASGAMTGVPSGFFAAAVLGVDVAYLVYQQFRLILGIGAIYGHEPSRKERFNEALACLAYGSGITLGKHGLNALLGSAAIEGGIIAEKIGTRLIADRFSKLIPVLGVVSGGALNYWVVRAVGRTTIRYYEGRIEPAVADEIWSEGDREHA